MKVIYELQKSIAYSSLVLLVYIMFSRVSLAQEIKQQEKKSQQNTEADTLTKKSSSDAEILNNIVYPKRQGTINQQGDNKEATFEKKFVPVSEMKSTNTNLLTPNPIQPK